MTGWPQNAHVGQRVTPTDGEGGRPLGGRAPGRDDAEEERTTRRPCARPEEGEALMQLEPREKRVFDELVTVALEGRRCPTNDELRASKGIVGKLCRAGFIRSEVYERNYRVIEIRSGEHAGKRTAEHPGGRHPYRVIDDKGDQWVSRTVTGARAVRHVPREADTRSETKATAITLPRVKFLEGEA